MSGKRVLLLDDDINLTFVMREILLTFGAKSCRAVSSYEELVANRNDALSSDLAILDVNLGLDRFNGIDAYNWLKNQGYEGEIAFFTGHANSHPWVRAAMQIPKVKVVEKPADIDKIEALLQ